MLCMLAHIQIHRTYRWIPRVGNGLHRLHAARGFAAEILPAIVDGRMQPMIDRVYGLDELPAAKAHMASNERPGKIVVRMQDTQGAATGDGCRMEN